MLGRIECVVDQQRLRRLLDCERFPCSVGQIGRCCPQHRSAHGVIVALRHGDAAVLAQDRLFALGQSARGYVRAARSSRDSASTKLLLADTEWRQHLGERRDTPQAADRTTSPSIVRRHARFEDNQTSQLTMPAPDLPPRPRRRFRRPRDRPAVTNPENVDTQSAVSCSCSGT
jgi:hypothetical protein